MINYYKKFELSSDINEQKEFLLEQVSNFEIACQTSRKKIDRLNSKKRFSSK